MSALFTGGRIADLILGFMVLEAIALIAYRRRTGKGVPPTDFLTNLMAGFFLLLALRGALMSAAWGWIALCLTAALIGHLTDLWRKWRG